MREKKDDLLLSLEPVIGGNVEIRKLNERVNCAHSVVRAYRRSRSARARAATLTLSY